MNFAQMLLDMALQRQGAEVPAPPPGFVPDATDPAAPAAYMPPPPGFAEDNPVDRSSAMTDLIAGGKGLQNAGTMGAILLDQLRANSNEAFAQIPEQAVANLDSQIRDYQARISATTDPTERALLLEGLKPILAERRGYAEIGASADFQASAVPFTDTARMLEDRIVSERIPTLARRTAEIQALPVNPSAAAALRGTDGGALADTANFLSNFAADPVGVARTLTLNSLPQSAPTIGAGIAGGLVGGPAGAAAGSFAAGSATEALSYSSQKLIEALASQGVDVKDPAAVQAFMDTNKEALDQIYADGMKRGGIIGAFDALSGGIIGGLVGKAAAKGTLGTRLSAMGGGALAETLTEGAGEAAAGAATTGLSMPDVLAEMVGGGIPGTVQAGGQMLATTLKNPKAAKPAAAEAPPPPAGFVPDDATSDAPDPAPAPEADLIAQAEQQPAPEPTPVAPTSAPTWDEWQTMTDAEKRAAVDAGFMPPAPPAAPPAEQVTPPTEQVAVQPVAPSTDTDPAATPAEPAPVVAPEPQASAPAPQAAPEPAPVAEPASPQAGNEPVQAPEPAPAPVAATPDPAPLKPNHMTPDFADSPTLPKRKKADRVGVTNGQFTSQGNWIIRNDLLPEGNADSFQVEGKDAGAPSAGVIDRILSSFPDRLTNATPISWRVAVARDGTVDAARVTGVLPDGRSIAVDGQTFGFLVNRRGYTLAATADGKQIGVYNDAGERIGGVLPTRTGDEDSPAYLSSQPEYDTTQRPERGRQTPPSPNTAAPRDPNKPKLDRKAIEAKRGEALSALDEASAEIKRRMAAGDEEPVRVTLTTPSGKQTKFTFPPTEQGLAAVETTKKNWKSRPPEVLADAGMADVADTSADTQGQSASRGPRGGFTPGFSDVSENKGMSPFEQAWTDAGLTPDQGTILPPVQKVNVLSKLMKDTFGLLVERSAKAPIKAIDAVNQLLDAYRNTRFMLHTLGLPLEALSLGGTLRLSLESMKGRYLGMYDGSTRTIHMPGRSNSFAHEWGHALDHYLRDLLQPGTKAHLLTQAARREGLNPQNSIEEAFVVLINRMFFDDAALALRVMDLEDKASRTDKNGNPTKVALEAQRQLEAIADGSTKLRLKPSAYRENSQDYSPGMSGYYGSVHEMFARAFEAFIGHKMAMAQSGSNAFVTKGDEAYTSDADRRLAMTFPKATERAIIFEAFEQIFHHLRTQAVLGTGPAASRPTDTDLLDPAHWHKLDLAAKQGKDGWVADLKKEYNSIFNGLKGFVKAPRATLRDGVSNLALAAGLANGGAREALGNVSDFARWIVSSQRGFANMLIKRQPKEAQAVLRYVMSGIMTDPGTGNEQKFTVEAQSQQASTKVGSEIMSALKVSGLATDKFTGGLSKADNDTVRALMFGDQVVAGATAAHKAVAAALRRMMDRAYLKAVEAGLDMGYVENKGYLPRSVRADRVNLAPDDFRAKASEVYLIHFDNITADMDPAEVADLARVVSRRVDPFNEPKNGPFAAQLKAVSVAVSELKQAQSKARAARAAADADPTNAAKRAAAAKAASAVTTAQRTLNDAVSDLKAAIKTPYADTSAENWLRRIQTGTGHTFDSIGPDADFKAKRGLPPEAEAIMGDFYETDAITQVLDYTHSTTKRAAYQSHFGTETKADRLEAIFSREGVQNAMMQNPAKYSTKTPAGRLNILRDLTNPKTDNIKEMALEEARRAGADPNAITELRATIERIVGNDGARNSRHFERFTTAVYVWGTLALLPKAAITSLSEPVSFLLRTGDVKNTGRVFATYLREAVRGAKDVQELAALSEMVGVVASPLHDIALLNRVTDGAQFGGGGNVILSRFFRATFLTQLTNAQRRATLAGGFYMMRDMARRYSTLGAEPKGRRDAAIIRAEFRDLGVAEGNIDGFMNWLASKDGLPSLDDVNTPEGQQFAGSVARFVDTTIQNPSRADKTALAMTPFGRLAFGLTSFIYSFYANMHKAIVTRAVRDRRLGLEAGMSDFEATTRAFGARGLQFVGGFAAIITAQFLVGAVRAAIFDRDQWAEHEDKKKDDVYEWLFGLALSRSGLFGPADVLLQSVTGLRYERDLTSLTSGPQIGYLLSNLQNMLNAMPRVEVGPYGIGSRNSPDNSNAEHTGVKSFYRGAMAPAATALLSLIPMPGAVSNLARAAVIQGVSSNTAASAFADEFFTKKK